MEKQRKKLSYWPSEDGVPRPSPDDIYRARGLDKTQEEMAKELGFRGRDVRNKVSDMERGRRPIDYYRWCLWLLKQGRHPRYKLVPRQEEENV